MGELVRMIDGVAGTTSLLVAEAFDKRHADVLRVIEGLIRDAPALAPKFQCKMQIIPSPNGATRESRYFTMDEEAWFSLVTSFTGPKAARIKRAFFAEFMRMRDVIAGMALVEARPVQRSSLLEHPDFATAEARDAHQLMLNTLRTVERMKGTTAQYAVWRAYGKPDLDELQAHYGLLPSSTEQPSEKPMATIMVWAEDAGVQRSTGDGIMKYDLYVDYETWAVLHECRSMEPAPFFRLVRDHFRIESRHNRFPLLVTRPSAHG